MQSPLRPREDPILVDLALQGGGAHGAFTWGVLDRLLEEPWLKIEGISGTSAGAMNAAVLAQGLASGGVDGAKTALAQFWRRVSDAALISPFRRSPLDMLLGRWTLDTSPMFLTLDLMARIFSPYDLNPHGANPLREILARSIDFKHLAEAPVKLFVTATNVHSGQGRVFRNAELTPEVLLASACLPTLFQAVEIDGEAYWDGGYAGNPTITPLIRECQSSDTILVQVNPVERPGTPRTARDIVNRLNEVSFNATLAQGASHDGGAARGRRPRLKRRRALGENAHSPHRQRDHGRAWLFLQAQRGVGVSLHAAGTKVAARRKPFFSRMPPISGRARRSISIR